MPNIRGKRWLLVEHFDGYPKESDVRLEEFDVPELKEGEVLLEAEFISVDPYMRIFANYFAKGQTIPFGQQVAKVIESCHPDVPVGTWSLLHAGWTTHKVCSGDGLTRIPPLPEAVSRSCALGTLGMPGLTAYFALLDICTPKAGETVLVSGAAGAVGNVVGQIAKIKGCRVIGSAGTVEKLEYLKEIGFDDVFNYKTTTDLDAKLKELAPGGIDVYFDNVGGDFASTAIMNMNMFGRIANCGAISSYNLKERRTMPDIFPQMIHKQLKMQGLQTSKYRDRWAEGLTELSQWVSEGKIKIREHRIQGVENMFKGFMELFEGANIGKSIVQV